MMYKFIFSDIDECEDNPCNEGMVCTNTEGSYKCTRQPAPEALPIRTPSSDPKTTPSSSTTTPSSSTTTPSRSTTMPSRSTTMPSRSTTMPSSSTTKASCPTVFNSTVPKMFVRWSLQEPSGQCIVKTAAAPSKEM